MKLANWCAILLGVLSASAFGQKNGSDIPDTPPIVQLTYPNVTLGSRSHRLGREPLYLHIVNNADAPVVIDVQARAVTDDLDTTLPVESLALDLREQRTITLGSDVTPPNPAGRAVRGQLLVTGRVMDSSGRKLGNVQAPWLFYNGDGSGDILVSRKPIHSAIKQTPEVGDAAPTHRFVAVPGGGGGTPSFGWNVQVCFTLRVSFYDRDSGEDYWTENDNKPAYGIYVKVRDHNGATFYEGYTGDGITGEAGCTPWGFTYDLSNWRITAWALAKVRGNYVKVYRSPENDNDVSDDSFDKWDFVKDLNGGKNTLSVPALDAITSTLAAASFALYRDAGGMSNNMYEFHVGADDNYNRYSKIFLTDLGGLRKVTIVHEMGHRMLHLKLGADYRNDTSYNAPSPCDTEETGPLAHSMTSKEYSVGAFNEGFSYFYAAFVWNDSSQHGGNIMVKDTPIDVESGHSYLKTTCASPYRGFGNEKDWLRFFWDFLTEAGSKPTFTDIVNLIDAAGRMDDSILTFQPADAFSYLDEAAVTFANGVWLDRLRFLGEWNGLD